MVLTNYDGFPNTSSSSKIDLSQSNIDEISPLIDTDFNFADSDTQPSHIIKLKSMFGLP